MLALLWAVPCDETIHTDCKQISLRFFLGSAKSNNNTSSLENWSSFGYTGIKMDSLVVYYHQFFKLGTFLRCEYSQDKNEYSLNKLSRLESSLGSVTHASFSDLSSLSLVYSACSKLLKIAAISIFPQNRLFHFMIIFFFFVFVGVLVGLFPLV